MVERHLRKCSTFAVIREKEIQTTLRYHLIPVRMAKIKITDDNLCRRGCGAKGTLLHCGGSNWYSHLGYQYGNISEN